jgi:hypothetical protein
MKNTMLPRKRDVRFLLCEDIRQEGASKSSLLGLIPGERFMVGGPPPPGAPSNVAFVLPSLAFMFIIGGGRGSYKGRFKIVAPDKKTVIVDTPTDKAIQLVQDRTGVFATGTKPFVGPGFGTYTVQFEIGDAKFKFPMVIEKGPLNPKAP